jgi:DNA helicase-2/ATP-dependent DNA helicase PcrA
VRQQGAHGDKHVYALRSRFIPDGLTAFFDACASPAEHAAAEANTAREPVAPIDVAARIRARWSRAS